MKDRIKICVKCIFNVFLIHLMYACYWEPESPSILVEADSLLMHGNYELADSLLFQYDHSNDDTSLNSRCYRRLLGIGQKFVNGSLTSDDFSLADSLCRYYEPYTHSAKYGKALCFLGEVYHNSADYPSALKIFLKATEVAEECGDFYLLGWLYRGIGDVYFDQRMLDECTTYYRKYYEIAVIHQDTLRMALSAYRMGKVYTIYNNVDSIVFYYEKAIRLAKNTKHPEYIIPYSKYSLSDIYIQLEEYEKARALMTHDSLNDANWAYWHLGQQHTDSAIYYFKKFKNRYGFAAYATASRQLAKLEETQGNLQNALNYYKSTLTIEDSIKSLSQVTETKRVQAQYNLNLIKQERDEMTHKSQMLLNALSVVFVIIILASIMGYYAIRYYRQKRNNELIQERLLRREIEEKNKLSVSKLHENEQKIIKLKQQLSDALQAKDSITATKIKLDTDLLNVENQNIVISQRRQEFMLAEFKKTPLYIRIQLHAGDDDFHLSGDEWKQLASYIDETFDDFTQRIISLITLSDIEMKVCYLIKVGLSPSAIAVMLCKSKTAISMLRQRLYKKITNKKGSPKQLDEFILNF